MVYKVSFKKYLTYVLVVILVATCFLIYSNLIMDNDNCENQTIALAKNSICVPIIMYHEVKNCYAGKDVITPYEFESDLKYLKENNFTTITMTDLINHVYKKTPLPANPVILTFDDGYYNNYVYAFPLLKKYHMKIVLSIIGKNTDDFSGTKDININYSHVTWNQINEMKKSGLVEIQNHTYNLHSISQGRFGCGKMFGESERHYEMVLTDDIQRLQKEVTLYTQATPNTFTYPYGKISDASLPVIKKLGFKASLTCIYGINIINYSPECLFQLKRVCRSHNYTIKKAIDGAVKTLKYRKDYRTVGESDLT